MGVRAEQQVLAKHGLNYVIEKYLPQKLKKADSFLPKVLIYPRCGKKSLPAKALGFNPFLAIHKVYRR